MMENDFHADSADESADKREKLEFGGSNRTLGDYTDLTEELDCLQLEDEEEDSQ